MTPKARKPKGYVGSGHETIGSDILAVFGVVSMPKQTLGESLHRRLQAVKAEGWYPIELLLELMDTLDAKLGQNALRQMGRKLFQASHEVHVKAVAKSAADILYGFDDLYARANRGHEIGGWTMPLFGRGIARLDKNTPHHCALEEGIIAEALNCVGVPASVSQEACFRKGAESCVFVVSSFVTDERWGAAR